MYSLQQKAEGIKWRMKFICHTVVSSVFIASPSLRIWNVTITEHLNITSLISQNLEGSTFPVISFWWHFLSQNYHQELCLVQVFPPSPQLYTPGCNTLMVIRQMRRSLVKPSCISAVLQKQSRDDWEFVTLQRESRRGSPTVPGKGNETLWKAEEDQKHRLSLSSKLENPTLGNIYPVTLFMNLARWGRLQNPQRP